MTTADSLREELIQALVCSDDSQRSERADRIMWMSNQPSAIMGAPETLAVLGEAENAFREGHFISVIMLAMALVEHTIVEELVNRSVANFGVPLGAAIKLSRENKILEQELLDRIDKIREFRNPFAHRKAPSNSHTFGNRYIAQKLHPRIMLQQDAQEAFQVMYQVFRALLKAA